MAAFCEQILCKILWAHTQMLLQYQRKDYQTSDKYGAETLKCPPAYSQGVDLVHVEYIPDNKADIVATVMRLKQRVGPAGFVFSSGGIGPTHDDVTYESLAEAFGGHPNIS